MGKKSSRWNNSVLPALVFTSYTKKRAKCKKKKRKRVDGREREKRDGDEEGSERDMGRILRTLYYLIFTLFAVYHFTFTSRRCYAFLESKHLILYNERLIT